MLTDAQTVSLGADQRYRGLLRVGLKRLGSDIVASGNGEFRADAAFGTKFIYALVRSRIIRSELASCTDQFIKKFIDADLHWPHSPDSLKDLCDSYTHGFVWMRYDEPRVEALFHHCKQVLTDPEFRQLVKNFSTIPGCKNARLQTLLDELGQFHRVAVRSIRTRGLFDGLISMQKDEFYQNNERLIQEKFLSAAVGGKLGLPPCQPPENL